MLMVELLVLEILPAEPHTLRPLYGVPVSASAGAQMTTFFHLDG